MDRLEFTKKGLIGFKWNAIKQKYEKFSITGESIFHDLRTSCTIKENFTLGDLFSFVEKNENLKSFLKSYSWCHHIDEFHKQAQEKTNSNKKLKFIQIHPIFDCHSFDKEASLHIYPAMSVVGENEEGIEVNYCPSFIPMGELKDLPMKIERSIPIGSPLGSKKYKKYEEFYKAEITFSLLDILDSIYWEISFYGGPKEKQELADTLDKRVKDLDSGKVKSIPFEEFKKKLKKKLSKKKKK